jgi:acyl carrier protein
MEESEVKRVIAEKLGVPVDEKTQLAAVAQDSFAKVEMLFEIERQLGVRIPDQGIIDMETVGDLISAIENSRKK